MKMRIAFISEHASPLAPIGGVDSGGQNVYVDKLARKLADFGHKVDVFTRWDDRRLPMIVKMRPGVRVVHMGAGPKAYVPKEQLLGYMPDFIESMIAFIARQRFAYSLIHANFFMSGLVAVEIKRRFRIPFVITFHALGKIRNLHQGRDDLFPQERFAIEETVLKEADSAIAECPQDRRDLIHFYGAATNRITTIPCGFDPQELQPVPKLTARKVLGLNPDEKIVLQLGRMVPRKGVDNVIEAMGLLIKKLGLPVKLLIVGGQSPVPDPASTPEIDRLRLLAKQAGIEREVIFTGRKNRDRLKYYYSAADAFVSTPWYEPFGITPLEAMACGTPVIGSRVGGIKFSVIDNVTGFLVPPKAPVPLAEKMYRLLTDAALAEKFSANALRRVRSLFTWEKIALQIQELYEKVLNYNFITDRAYGYKSGNCP